MALVVAGSLSSNPADRSLNRSQVWPVQVIVDGEAHVAPLLREVGKRGISALAFVDPSDAAAPVFLTCGETLSEFRAGNRTIRDCGLKALVDVHEISWERDRILLANTGNDEVVVFSPRGRECTRLSLDPLRRHGGTPQEGVDRHVVDRFHANQAFRGLDGNLWALVHHVKGRQLLRSMLGGVIKSQGDGGVLNLDQSIGIDLNLAAPHSVRIVGEEYWLMNSGCREIVTYSRAWQKRCVISCLGWGRGLAICGDIAYAGISPIRRRYHSLIGGPSSEPTIQALRISTGEPVAHATLFNLEQVNNIYCVARSVGMALLHRSSGSQ